MRYQLQEDIHESNTSIEEIEDDNPLIIGNSVTKWDDPIYYAPYIPYTRCKEFNNEGSKRTS